MTDVKEEELEKVRKLLEKCIFVSNPQRPEQYLSLSGNRAIMEGQMFKIIGGRPSQSEFDHQDNKRKTMFDTFGKNEEELSVEMSILKSEQIEIDNEKVSVYVCRKIGSDDLKPNEIGVLKLMRNEDCRVLVRLMKKCIHDVFQLPNESNPVSSFLQSFYQTFSDKAMGISSWKTASESDFEQLLDTMEHYITTKLNDKLFEIEKRNNQQKDLLIYQRCKVLQTVDLNRFHGAEETLTVDVINSLLESYLNVIQKLNNTRSSIDKLHLFVRLGRILQNQLKDHWNIEPGADVLFPCILSLVIHSTPNHYMSHLQYVQHYHNVNRMNGESAYFFTNMLAVATFIENISPSSVNLDNESFDKLMEDSLSFSVTSPINVVSPEKPMVLKRIDSVKDTLSNLVQDAVKAVNRRNSVKKEMGTKQRDTIFAISDVNDLTLKQIQFMFEDYKEIIAELNKQKETWETDEIMFISLLLWASVAIMGISSNDSSTTEYIILLKMENSFSKSQIESNAMEHFNWLEKEITSNHVSSIVTQKYPSFHAYRGRFDSALVSKLSEDARVESVQPVRKVKMAGAIDQPWKVDISIGTFHVVLSEQDTDSMKITSKSKLPPPELKIQNNAPWGLSRISHVEWNRNVRSQYQYNYQGANVQVYVIDTGVYIQHQEFEGRAEFGKNFLDNEDDTDYVGHGTHVSGTIAGKTFGVAKKAKIIGLKVLDKHGNGNDADVLAAMEYVYDKRLRNDKVPMIINLSLGGEKSMAMNRAVEMLVAANVHVVAAAGNSFSDACNESPSSAESIISVAAMDEFDGFAFFSNYGKCVHIIAPGVNILSSIPSGKASFSGTSMSSPHVAGVVAMYLEKDPQMTPLEMREMLQNVSIRNVIRNVRGNTFNGLLTTTRMLE